MLVIWKLQAIPCAIVERSSEESATGIESRLTCSVLVGGTRFSHSAESSIAQSDVLALIREGADYQSCNHNCQQTLRHLPFVKPVNLSAPSRGVNDGELTVYFVSTALEVGLAVGSSLCASE